MRIAFISDIHGNLPALLAVFELIDSQKPDRIISLGDIVGYGPYPSECVEFLQNRNIVNLLGNHDAGVIGTQDLKLFREPNHSWLKWSKTQLSSAQLAYLEKSPLTLDFPEFEGLAVHASPDDPTRWIYLDSALECRNLLARRPERIIFCGHTHKAAVVAEKLGIMRVQPGHRFVINPGSIGQPRENDKRASFGVFDTETFSWQLYKVEYDKTPIYKRFKELKVDAGTAHRLMPLSDEH
jgi:predicted phosphodiesterase